MSATPSLPPGSAAFIAIDVAAAAAAAAIAKAAAPPPSPSIAEAYEMFTANPSVCVIRTTMGHIRRDGVISLNGDFGPDGQLAGLTWSTERLG